MPFARRVQTTASADSSHCANQGPEIRHIAQHFDIAVALAANTTESRLKAILPILPKPLLLPSRSALTLIYSGWPI